MSKFVLYFSEYTYITDRGNKFSPYIDLETNQWRIAGSKASLEEVGKLCNLDEDELVMLRLKYGA